MNCYSHIITHTVIDLEKLGDIDFNRRICLKHVKYLILPENAKNNGSTCLC